MALRTCRDCGLEAHTVEDLGKFKTNKKSRHGRENLCNKCSNLRYGKDSDYHKKWHERNPDYHKKWQKAHPDYPKNRINFKGKRIRLAENPRKNVCSECGRSYPEDLSRQTCMHHIVYDKTDPLAWTVELCLSCHTKLHAIRTALGLREHTY